VEKNLKQPVGFIKRWFLANPFSDYVQFIFLSIIIGSIASLAAVLFYKCIKILNHLGFDWLPHKISQLPSWYLVLIPVIGGAIVGSITLLFPETAKRRGVIEVIKSSTIYGGLIHFKTTLLHFFAPIIFIGTGGTLGPEGPAAQLGAGIGSLTSQLLRLSEKHRKTFLAAGTAAAIAAVFNAPIGGVFFALEIVLLNNFRTLTLSILIIASVTADYISRLFLGDHPLLLLPPVQIQLSEKFFLFALLGLLAGFLSLLFLKITDLFKAFFTGTCSSLSPLLKILPATLLLGVTGYFFPQIFGIGYETIKQMAGGNLPLLLLLVLTVLKLVFTPLLLGAGGYGGVFAPSLFIGAGFGALFATVGNQLFGLNLDIAAFSIVGMAAVLAGVNSIPIAALMIIVELTNNYQLILPLMLGIIMSIIVVHYTLKESIHTLDLKRQGIQLFDGRELNILKKFKVSQVMNADFVQLTPSMNFKTLLEIVTGEQASTYWVIDADAHLLGYLTLADIRPILMEYDQINHLVLVSDIMSGLPVTVTPADDLDYVMKLFGRYEIEELPVVDPESQKLIGKIERQQLIQLYNREIFQRETVGDLATHIENLGQARFLEIDSGFSLLEMKAPSPHFHQNLRSLDLRNQFGIQVVLLKHHKPNKDEVVETPGPDSIILPGDTLIIVGKTRKIHEFREKYLA
jgi:CIC family chloride channel protein